ncbi:Chromosome partition protein Smc [Nymphon striatum]|nr:Chromosome partition protein Smc [Nymphon striatum]
MALIFAVFLTNPAPICVLDEVDAPLDDHNVERFCNLMDEMSCFYKNQICTDYAQPDYNGSHDRMFGVTMAERGVSQLHIKLSKIFKITLGTRMDIKAVIFDKDGTITDFSATFNPATKLVLEGDLRRHFCGLEALHGGDILLGIGTNDSEENAINQLEALDVDHLFEHIFGADSGYGAKPGSGMIDAFVERCIQFYCRSSTSQIRITPQGLRTETGTRIYPRASTIALLNPCPERVLEAVRTIVDDNEWLLTGSQGIPELKNNAESENTTELADNNTETQTGEEQ